MKSLLKNCYHFSDYQIAQLQHLVKTTLSEFSKLLILGFLFREQPDIFCVGMAVLLLLRTSTGGLHCKTYLSCLAASFIYLFISLKLLPAVYVSRPLKLLLLGYCMAVNYLIGPVTSDVHLPLSAKCFKKGRISACLIILFFGLFTYIVPENIYLNICFWIIILHTLQLITAKIRKKGGFHL